MPPPTTRCTTSSPGAGARTDSTDGLSRARTSAPSSRRRGGRLPPSTNSRGAISSRCGRTPRSSERLLSCLTAGNRSWAGSAPVLALGAARLNFTRNEVPNAVALHDLGLASGNLSVEATARGLHVHQMRGILPDLAREIYGVPAGFEVVTALAIGYAAPAEELAPPLRERDLSPRSRRPLGESVFSGAWGEAADVLSPS